LDGSVFALPNVGGVFLVLGHEDIDGGIQALLWLAPLILLPLAILRTLWLDHPWRPFFSYDDLLAFGQFGLRWSNQDLLRIELDQVHIHREWVLVELYLGAFCKFQSSFVYGRLNLPMKNIVIISSMAIRIISFTISMLFELFW
jgi:hypothetical protein